MRGDGVQAAMRLCSGTLSILLAIRSGSCVKQSVVAHAEAYEVSPEEVNAEQGDGGMTFAVHRIDVPSWAREPNRNIGDAGAWQWFQARMPAIEQAIHQRLLEYVNDPQITSTDGEGYPNQQDLTGAYYLSHISVRIQQPQHAGDRELWIMTVMVECLGNSETNESEPYIGWEAGVLHWPATGGDWELDSFEQRAR